MRASTSAASRSTTFWALMEATHPPRTSTFYAKVRKIMSQRSPRAPKMTGRKTFKINFNLEIRNQRENSVYKQPNKNKNRQHSVKNIFFAGSSIENRNPGMQKLLIDILKPRFDPNLGRKQYFYVFISPTSLLFPHNCPLATLGNPWQPLATLGNDLLGVI